MRGRIVHGIPILSTGIFRMTGGLRPSSTRLPGFYLPRMKLQLSFPPSGLSISVAVQTGQDRRFNEARDGGARVNRFPEQRDEAGQSFSTVVRAGVAAAIFPNMNFR
jgi:hypothetical protein